MCLVVGQDLALQVENETDWVALLPKVVGLLFVQVGISSTCSFISGFLLSFRVGCNAARDAYLLVHAP